MKNLILVLVIIFIATALPAQSVFVGGESDTLWYHDTGKDVRDVRFSPDDQYLAVAMSKSPVQLFDVQTGELKEEFKDTEGTSFYDVEFSRDAKKLYAAGSKSLTLVTSEVILEEYDVESGANTRNLLDGYDNIHKYHHAMNLAISDDGNFLAVTFISDKEGASDYGLIIWDTETWEIHYETSSNICKTVFIPGTHKLLVNMIGYKFIIYDLDAENINDREELNYTANSSSDYFDISHDGKKVYISSRQEQTNLVYDLIENKVEKTFIPIKYRSRKIKSSLFDNIIVCDTKEDPTEPILVIYDTEHSKIIHEYQQSPYQALAISNNQMYIASAVWTIVIYNARWGDVGVEDKKPSEEIIYPNPTDGHVILKMDIKNPEQASIEITDPQGKKIMEIEHFLNIGINEIPLDVSFLSPGAYFIRLKTDSFFTTYKLIKE
jgi:Secretion system C-terminal sorting domain/Anaphase-promoting complex subunit 4 WD40 domain